MRKTIQGICQISSPPSLSQAYSYKHTHTITDTLTLPETDHTDTSYYSSHSKDDKKIPQNKKYKKGKGNQYLKTQKPPAHQT